MCYVVVCTGCYFLMCSKNFIVGYLLSWLPVVMDTYNIEAELLGLVDAREWERIGGMLLDPDPNVRNDDNHRLQYDTNAEGLGT